MHDSARTANLLGATALAVTDLVLADVARATGVGTSAAAALVVLSATPAISVTEIGRRIGLSQPAAARMVTTLEAADLVRRSARSGREVSVQLTPAGERAASKLLGARGRPLTDLLSALDPAQQAALADLLTPLLARLYSQVGNSELLCRLCDRASCTSGATCPVGQAERERDG
jgi:DNA-binding MarR family transcriptional regulator